MVNKYMSIFNHNLHLFLLLIFFDLLMLLLHLLFGSQQPFFHLDFEQNLPTYYQTIKLVSFGGLFLILSVSKLMQRKIMSFVLPLSIFMIFLGLDEGLQIHENIYRLFEYTDIFHPNTIVMASMKMGYRSSLWMLYYLPFIFIFVFWSGYWLRYFQSKMKNNAWTLALSSLSLLIVLIAEMLSSTGTYGEHEYFWLVTIEESAELLFASTLIFVESKVINIHV
jgi:hypothetical protein